MEFYLDMWNVYEFKNELPTNKTTANRYGILKSSGTISDS